MPSRPNRNHYGNPLHYYRGETITEHPGFVIRFTWLGTIGFETLADAKAAIDAAPWNNVPRVTLP